MKEFHLIQSTISQIIREGRRRPKKQGRPTKLSNAERRTLVRYAGCNPMTSAKQIAQVTGLPVSESTIQRELKRNEFHHEKVQISEHLSPMNMEKQLVFA